MNKHAREMERMSKRVALVALGIVALLCGFRFAMDWYSGPSMWRAFAITGLAGTAIFIVLWRWGEPLGTAYGWFYEKLPFWLRDLF